VRDDDALGRALVPFCGRDNEGEDLNAEDAEDFAEARDQRSEIRGQKPEVICYELLLPRRCRPCKLITLEVSYVGES
jgi:hypothetical protein